MDVDEQQLNIRLANESEVFGVDASLMRACSSIARGLPAEAAVWDLSNLLIDGQPVQCSTVIRWLNCCYIALHGRTFDGRPVNELWQPTAAELFQLLAFADSIGSVKAPITMSSAEEQLMYLQINVLLSQQLTHSAQQQQQQERVVVPMHAVGYCIASSALQAQPFSLVVAGRPEAPLSAAAKYALVLQMAAQAEQLLYIVHKLQLHELLQIVKDFIAAATRADERRHNAPQPLLSRTLLHDVVYR
jgi:hypothetical protein